MVDHDPMTPTKPDAAAIAVRICFCVVFLLNIQCALSFILVPGNYVTSYQLEGSAGMAAIQGIGVAFLMWNATYPTFIIAPRRYAVLGGVILAQQVIGLIGESIILFSIMSDPALSLLFDSIMRFIIFDGVGLLVMAVSFTFFLTRR